MKVHIRAGDIHLHDTTTRLPFKYGIATMTAAPHLFLRLRVEVEGTLCTGIAADGLPPKWFTKDPNRPLNDEIHEMLAVIENALRLALDLRADSAHDAWRNLYDAQSAWGKEAKLPPLLTQFGKSLVERALIEAVCKASGRPFHAALRAGDLGSALTDDLRPTPLDRIVARHTVGLLDPLHDADIPEAERRDDGLPQSLAASIDAYGLRQFKIKVSGDLDRDRDRLNRIAELLNKRGRYAFSLDGNEQFGNWPQFRSYWESLCREPLLKLFWPHLLFVEQPLHRSVAMKANDAMELYHWTARPPILIDESDDEPDAMKIAWSFGYAGTSHKNCKGVFKSVANVAHMEMLRREEPGRPRSISGEDLANIGPVALLQDLAVCAALGVASVERNGHHYFAGLSMWPDDIQEQVQTHHGDLYTRSRDGWPTLRIENGVIDVGSLNRAPLGVGFEVPVERFQTPDQWRRAHPLETT